MTASPEDNRLQCLQAILDGSRKMLALAQQAQWDELVACELQRRQAVTAFKTSHETLGTPLSPGQEALRREILDLDNATRQLADVWLGETNQQLSSFNTSRKLRSVYLGLG